MILLVQQEAIRCPARSKRLRSKRQENILGDDILAKNLKLKSARAAMDMSQQALAEKVGVSRQTINAIEKGDYNPTLNLCIAICRALGKTLDEVFWDRWLS